MLDAVTPPTRSTRRQKAGKSPPTNFLRFSSNVEECSWQGLAEVNQVKRKTKKSMHQRLIGDSSGDAEVARMRGKWEGMGGNERE
jgi:hypothetical protein